MKTASDRKKILRLPKQTWIFVFFTLAFVIFHFVLFFSMLANPFHLDDMFWLAPLIENITKGRGFFLNLFYLASPFNGEWTAPILNVHMYVITEIFGPSAAALNRSMLILHEFSVILLVLILRRWIHSKLLLLFALAFGLFWLPTLHAQTWVEATQHVYLILGAYASILLFFKIVDLPPGQPVPVLILIPFLVLAFFLGFTKLSCVLVSLGFWVHFFVVPEETPKKRSQLLKILIAFSLTSIFYQVIIFLNGGSGMILGIMSGSSLFKGFAIWTRISLPIQMIFLGSIFTAMGFVASYWLQKHPPNRRDAFAIACMALVVASFKNPIPMYFLWAVIASIVFQLYFRKVKYAGFALLATILFLSGTLLPIAAGLRALINPLFEILNNQNVGMRWAPISGDRMVWPYFIGYLACIFAIFKYSKSAKHIEVLIFLPLAIITALGMNTYGKFIPSRYFIYFLPVVIIPFLLMGQILLEKERAPFVRISFCFALGLFSIYFLATSISAFHLRHVQSMVGQSIWAADHIAASFYLKQKNLTPPFALVDAPIYSPLASWKEHTGYNTFASHLDEPSFLRSAWSALNQKKSQDPFVKYLDGRTNRTGLFMGQRSEFPEARKKILRNYLVGNLPAKDWQRIFPSHRYWNWAGVILYPSGGSSFIPGFSSVDGYQHAFVLGWSLATRHWAIY